jgi:hypothetical protein
MPRLGCHLESSSPGDELLSTAKGLLAFAGYCWAGEYIEGPALEGSEGFFYIWLTPPGYRIKLLSGGDSGAGCRIPAEFVGDGSCSWWL